MQRAVAGEEITGQEAAMVQWRGRRRSSNVEDRRGRGRGGMIGGGLGLLVIVVLAALFGVDPRALLEMGGEMSESAPATPYEGTPEEEEMAEFTSVILADTEETWRRIFRENGVEYREPTLVLFTGQVRSGCGAATAATGPFYCPLDGKVYIDLSFYDALQQRLGAEGDFAQAYVISHEVGHHVQNLLGIADRVRARQEGATTGEANALSVRMELQADCLAGVWAFHAERARDLLEAGDIEEGLGAAAAIGDDRLQRRGQGYTVPESFTHGTSAQRVRWFRTGLDSGDVDACDTFAGSIS